MLATHPLLFPRTHKGFLVLVSQYLLTMSETWFRGRHVALMAVLLVRSALQYAGQGSWRMAPDGEKLLSQEEAWAALLRPLSHSHFCISMQVREQKEGTVLWPASITTAYMNEKKAT